MRKISFIPYLIYLLILALPLYVVRFKFFDLPTTLLELIFFILIAVWLVESAVYKIKIKEVINIIKNPSLLPTLIFLFAGVVSVFVSPSVYKGLGAFRAYILEPIVVYLIILITANKISSLTAERIRGFLILSGLPLSIYGLYQYFTGVNAIAPLEAVQGRITSLFNHPNFLAMYVGPLILLTIGLMLESTSQLKKPLLFIILFLYTITLYLTFSQGAAIALISSLVFFLGMKFYRQLKDLQKSLVNKILVFSFIAFFIAFAVFFFNIEKFTPKNKLVWPRPNPDTFVIRLCLWEGTKGLIAKSPVFGAGLSGFYQVYPTYRTCDTEHFSYPHNIILNFWSEMGILGLVSFFWLVFTLYKVLLNVGEKKYFAAALASSLLYWLIFGLVDVPYLKNDLAMYFWIIAALVILIQPKGMKKDPSQS